MCPALFNPRGAERKSSNSISLPASLWIQFFKYHILSPTHISHGTLLLTVVIMLFSCIRLNSLKTTVSYGVNSRVLLSVWIILTMTLSAAELSKHNQSDYTRVFCSWKRHKQAGKTTMKTKPSSCILCTLPYVERGENILSFEGRI